MILTCPECQTRYQADAAQFPPDGRKVRCAKCGHVWHEAAPTPELVAAGTPPAELATPANRDEKPAPRPWSYRLGLLAGWATLGAVLVLIGWTGFRYRQEIAALWPQSSSMFATFGIADNVHQLAIDDTSYRRETEHGVPIWVVTGTLVNQSSHELAVPPVRVALTSGDHRELYHWTVRPPQRTLKPGQSLEFSARIPSPPPSARQVQLGFAGPE